MHIHVHVHTKKTGTCEGLPARLVSKFMACFWTRAIGHSYQVVYMFGHDNYLHPSADEIEYSSELEI